MAQTCNWVKAASARCAPPPPPPPPLSSIHHLFLVPSMPIQHHVILHTRPFLKYCIGLQDIKVLLLLWAGRIISVVACMLYMQMVCIQCVGSCLKWASMRSDASDEIAEERSASLNVSGLYICSQHMILVGSKAIVCVLATSVV